MARGSGETQPEGGHVTVRYWAAARGAAGVDEDMLDVDGTVTLASLLARVQALHSAEPGHAGIGPVLAVCSVLVGDRPVTSADPADVVVAPGSVVELLPPFAGG
ncbi:MAG: MoaD/ThiS family protein [Actinomycetota bacterium]|nr:MoaD/ThiS family protein [Actinomycetota bacterium]